MKKAKIYVHGKYAGLLIEYERNKSYSFIYDENYSGPAVSLTMPLDNKEYHYNEFPPFFDGLLPEGYRLKYLLKYAKIDEDNLFDQLITVGKDMVGAVTVEKANE